MKEEMIEVPARRRKAMKNPAHRPSRTYPEAPVHRCEVALQECPFCGAPLRSTCWREVDKYVQTLEGPRHVVGYARRCSNPGCPQPGARYHATSVEKLSVPHVTYGWDVLAYIAARWEGEQKQFQEIWRELEGEYGIEISEREVGRLYRCVEALLLGQPVAVEQALRGAVEKYGRLILG